MAGPAPNTKLWTARENAHKPSGLHLLVDGQVEVSDANKTPVLTETKGDGTVLALDLTITECTDPAIQVPVWKAASFHKVVDANQFASVAIRWAGKTIATTPVIDDKERAALMDKQAKAQNAIAPKPKISPKKTSPEKKTAPKKAAATKSAAKQPVVAKPGAKKAAKKVTKKATKKAAKKVAKKTVKKVAKKSTLKKLVRKLVKKLTPKKKDRKGKRR